MSKAQGISVGAVVVGFLADIIGTFAGGVVIGIALVAQGIPPHAVTEQMREPMGLALSLVLGLGSTVFGGFIAGRVAGHSEVFHGGLVGALGLLVGVLFVSQYPLWFNAVCFGGAVPCAMLGGWLAASPRKNVSQRERHRDYEERGADW
jgi:hypothetical protein